MEFAIVMSLVIFISTVLLMYQFFTGSLIGTEEERRDAWPRRTRRAH